MQAVQAVQPGQADGPLKGVHGDEVPGGVQHEAPPFQGRLIGYVAGGKGKAPAIPGQVQQLQEAGAGRRGALGAGCPQDYPRRVGAEGVAQAEGGRTRGGAFQADGNGGGRFGPEIGAPQLGPLGAVFHEVGEFLRGTEGSQHRLAERRPDRVPQGPQLGDEIRMGGQGEHRGEEAVARRAKGPRIGDKGEPFLFHGASVI